MQDKLKKLIGDNINFVFVGEAGSGKSEISINFAKWLVQLQDKPVHFFDMDMTKPLFRSRDVEMQMEEMGIICHHEKQFMDAPTVVGGVNRLLKDEDCYVVIPVPEPADHLVSHFVTTDKSDTVPPEIPAHLRNLLLPRTDLL